MASSTDLYRLAVELMSGENWNEAASCLELACELTPRHASAYHLLGKIRRIQGRRDEAELYQRKSCELDPKLGWNQFALAEILAEKGEHSQSAERFKDASEALTDQPWIRNLTAEQNLLVLTGGQPLTKGLSPEAYKTWCVQLEPSLPPISQPLHHEWWVNPPQIPQQGWLVVRDENSQLRPGALQALERWLARCPWVEQPDMIYCDEDRITKSGRRVDPWFKPDWCQESFWAMPWLESFSAWRVSWLRMEQIPMPPKDPMGRKTWIWKTLERAPKIGHAGQILVHRRDVRRVASSEEELQLSDHLTRRGEKSVQVKSMQEPAGGFQLVWPTPRGLRCRIVIPTRNQAKLLSQCLESIRNTTNRSLFIEITVVDNGSDQNDLQALLAAWRERLGDRFRILRVDAPFNWSDLSNQGARHPAAGQGSPADLLLFLNNDIEATQAGWLEAMASQAVREPIGCVGALLCYPNQRLQHAGVVIGMHGAADHAYRHLPLDHSVHRGRSRLLSNWGAVTGACLMVRRALFEQQGGFDPGLPVEFNDVDFCLRLGQLGYRHVIPPEAVLIHHESQSRDARASSTAEAALQLMRKRWGQRLLHTAPWWPDAACPNSPDGRPREWGSA